MSIYEQKRRRIASIVFKKAWQMYKKGASVYYSFSECLKLAWGLILRGQRLIYSKVRAVTFRNQDGTSRQELLQRLTRYPAEDIAIMLRREIHNPFDTNAIKVIALVRNRGQAIVGFLSSQLAAEVAPLMDQNHLTIAFFERVTGSEILGLNFSFSIIPNIAKQSYYCLIEKTAPTAS